MATNIIVGEGCDVSEEEETTEDRCNQETIGDTEKAGEDSGGESDKNMNSDFDLSPEDDEELLQEIEKASKRVSILCAGPTGVGKSTLLNGLLGSKEGVRKDVDYCDGEIQSIDSFRVGKSLNRGTSEVHKREFVKNEITVTAWDTPGLEGRADIDGDYLERIKEECAGFNLFVYCIKADEARATEVCGKKSSLLKFTELFGPEMWENGIVVLTFCNYIVESLEENEEVNPELNVEEEFVNRIEEWKRKVHEALLRKGVDERIVENIPVVPAGSASSLSLPGYPFWLSNLFIKVQEHMKDEARVAYILLNQDRLKGTSDSSSTDSSEASSAGAMETLVVVLSGFIGVVVRWFRKNKKKE